MRSRWVELAALTGMFSVGAFTARSADDSRFPERPAATSENEAPPLRFQRVMVPVDRPEDWPREKKERYLPMPAAEFERRLAPLHDQTPSAAEPAAAQLVRAEYRARLTGDDLVEGDAVWQFEHRGSEQVSVTLTDCRLPLSDFQWTDSRQGVRPTRNGGDPRAIVGNDHSGQLAALVDRSGKLQSRWSLHGQRDVGGRLSFSLNLPACQMNVLQLSLPDDLEPEVDGAMMVRTGDVGEDGRMQWQIELGGKHQSTLGISPRLDANRTKSTTVLRESLTYALSPRGLELTAELHLDVVGAPLDQVKLLVEQPLAIVSVQMDHAELPQTSEETAAPQGIGSVTVHFPAPIQGSDHVLKVTAIAPLVWDARWRLPLVNLDKARWRQGDARLLVSDSVALDELQIQDCRQTSVEPLSPSTDEPTGGETIAVQLFNDRPVMEVVVSRRREQVRVAQEIGRAHV